VLERQLAQAEPLAPQEQAAVLAVDTAAPLDIEALAARWLAAGQDAAPPACSVGTGSLGP
jgi:hypothetical protein